MYVLGGLLDDEHDAFVSTLTASVLKLDPMQGTWSQAAPMPEARYALAACAVGSDIFIFGGYSDGDECSSVLKYGTVANEWSTLAPMPSKSYYHSASVLDGLVDIVGADSGSEVLRFDSLSGVWSTLAPTSRRRYEGASFVLAGRLYAAGGGIGDSSVERYDVTSNTWTDVADMLEKRCVPCAVTIVSATMAEEQDLFEKLIAKASSQRP
jgi:hypothetical protein